MGGIYASEWLRELWRTKEVWLLIGSINVLACISGLRSESYFALSSRGSQASPQSIIAVRNPP